MTIIIRGLWPCLLDLSLCDVYLYVLKDTDMVIILAQGSIQNMVSSVSLAELGFAVNQRKTFPPSFSMTKNPILTAVK